MAHRPKASNHGSHTSTWFMCLSVVIRNYVLMQLALQLRFIFPLALFVRLYAAEPSGAGWAHPPLGHITLTTNSTDTILLEVRTWPAGGKLSFPTPFPNITAAHLL